MTPTRTNRARSYPSSSALTIHNNINNIWPHYLRLDN